MSPYIFPYVFASFLVPSIFKFKKNMRFRLAVAYAKPRPHHLISWLIERLERLRDFCACIQPVGSAPWTDGPCHPYPSHATYCPDLSSSILLYTSALRIRDGQMMFRWLQTSLAPFHRWHLSRIGLNPQARRERAAGRRGLDSSVAWGKREGRMRETKRFS